jgi:hypothetical protein
MEAIFYVRLFGIVQLFFGLALLIGGGAGSRYFCESLFWASQPKQAAKT